MRECMEVRKKLVKDVGSCNFCRSGVIEKDNGDLEYSYIHVYVVKGFFSGGCSVRLCVTCSQELDDRVAMATLDRPT